MKKVIVLGSTGSVGRQALDVIDSVDNISVVGLGAYSNLSLLLEQKKHFNVKNICLLKDSTLGYSTFEQMIEMVDFDVLLASASSITSLKSVCIALKMGKIVALANKELLVCAGNYLNQLAKQYGGLIIPVDSEHSAIFQSLKGEKAKSIIITCSGGALRDYPLNRLPFATKDEVLAHPNWKMGDKITVDCATMANKGFEVIEATKLFDIDFDKVKVLMHRESLVHGMVELEDNTVIACLSTPDMRLPIQYALTYPKRIGSRVSSLDLVGKSLSFDCVDKRRYPVFDLIVEGGKKGDSVSAYLCGADEGAVNLFLKGNIPYSGIHRIIEKAYNLAPITSVDDVIAEQIYNEGIQLALDSVKR